MKIRLNRFECCDCNSEYWEESETAPEIELPDAIVSEWRQLESRREELQQYFEERAQPQIAVVYDERQKKWEREHPDEAAQERATAQRWYRLLFEQYKTPIMDRLLAPKDDKK